jgi:hypothetical protein
MEINMPRIVAIAEGALGSLSGLHVSQGLLGVTVTMAGQPVITISPMRGRLLVQCIQGLQVQPRKTHLLRQQRADPGWQCFVAGSYTGISSFVHQVAPQLGRVQPRVNPTRVGATLKLKELGPIPVAEVPRHPVTPVEVTLIERISELSPGDVEDISIRWARESRGAASARGQAIRALPPNWTEARERVLVSLENRRGQLGDDLPWGDLRGAALDALRAGLASETLPAESIAVLAGPWSGSQPPGN